MIIIRPNKRQKNKNKFSPEFAESSHLKSFSLQRKCDCNTFRMQHSYHSGVKILK